MRTELTIMELRQRVQQIQGDPEQPNRDALLESYGIIIKELEKLLSFYTKGTWI